MIKIVGNDIMRGGEKIGLIEGNDIVDENGNKLGYFTGNSIFAVDGRRLGSLAGNVLKTVTGGKFDIDDNRRVVTGGTVSDLARVAIRLLLGE